ncbi:hypothetical protein MZD04_gp122 [Pseudomonas phage Psa21]|uniref:Uncharacterized protein n=1 Tax=Pseudomonas phage Psa21 TaxID=2530023 RepID=A0A481W4H3_9CAUD|nr:hypothetical protein MZD04_gp122 [Pseudomonas phage Psa21]QBJ02650.1 hypothetical protein PSA21_122 [Pseudomonas phage Psa21]
MTFKGLFSSDPKNAMSQKDIELNTSRIKLLTAVGGMATMFLGMALTSVKLANELKK